jgi:nitrite reductase (NO-forming)
MDPVKTRNLLYLALAFLAFAAWMRLPLARAEDGATFSAHHASVIYTLRSGIAEGRMVFLGVGGDIDGKVNPELVVRHGERTQVNLINGEGAEHDIVVDLYGVRSNRVMGKGASTSISFMADKVGVFAYYCSIAGHREAGMQGRLRVVAGPRTGPAPPAPDISRDPSDAPPPIHARAPQKLRVDLTALEVKGRLDDKTTYEFWTFGGKVPGPLVRARVGDTLEVHFKNEATNVLTHSVDFHGAIGPGGGASFSQANPGEEKVFSFKATVPGLFVYHCATPSMAQHVTNGMFGLLLVEPEGGLPEADREFYLMQSELYTIKPFGAQGDQEMDYEKLMSEQPTYFLFNGAVGALTKEHPLRARLGETVRIFFGVGGPNFSSSFHVIGEIFDRVLRGAGSPLTGEQTVAVPPGGAAIFELKAKRGGHYVLVDHALSRVERGLEGVLIVDGPRDDDLMREGPAKR